MTTISWKGVSGDWSTAADWAGGKVPGATDNAVIGGTNSLTMTMNSAEAALGVDLDDANAVFDLNATLTLGSTFKVGAGKLEFNGAITGGTVDAAGGTIDWNFGTLTGVTVEGPLDIAQANEAIYITSGVKLTGAGGVGAGEIDLAARSSLSFTNTQTLANATVEIGGEFGIAGPLLAPGQTLTLASNLTLDQTYRGAGLRTGNFASDTVVNRGQINITYVTPGAWFTLSGSGAFDNAGSITIGANEYLILEPGSFTNTGHISIQSGGTLGLDCPVSGNALAGVASSGGDLFVGRNGVLDITGSKLAVGAGSPFASFLLNGGTITGGTITAGPGASFYYGDLVGVTLQGPVSFDRFNDTIDITNGISLEGAGGTGPGSLAVGGTLAFYGSQTLANATIAFGGYGNSNRGSQIGVADPTGAGVTLTMASSLDLVLVPQFAFLYTGAHANDAIVMDGTVVATPTAYGHMKVTGAGAFINKGPITVANYGYFGIASASFTNSGKISVASGGTLALDTALATSDLTGITNSGGFVDFGGHLNNTGATLAVGTSTTLGSVQLAGGTITGGTVAVAGAGITVSEGRLDGVTFEGTLNVSAYRGFLSLIDGVAFAGAGGTGTAAINLTGRASYLRCYGSQTLTNVHITLGSNYRPATMSVADTASTPSTLTLGSNVLISANGEKAQLILGDTLVNKGTIAATIAASNGYLDITGGGPFVNQGVVSVANGGYLIINLPSFTNTGGFTVGTGGTLTLETALATSGFIRITNSGGTVRLGGTIANGYGVTIGGTIVNTGATLSVGTGTELGALALAGDAAKHPRIVNEGGVIYGGVIADAGSGILAQGGTLSNVTFQGTLDMSANYSSLMVQKGLTLQGAGGVGTGQIKLTGSGDYLVFYDSQTLGAGLIDIGGGSGARAPQLEVEASGAAGATLTVASGVTLNHTGDVGVLYTGHYATDSIVNQGRIVVASTLAADNYLHVEGAGELVNQGTISIANGDVLIVGNAVIGSYGGFKNLGTISIASKGTLDLDTDLATANLGKIGNTGGTLAIEGGTLNNAGAILTLGSGSALGALTFEGGVVTGGTIVDNASGLIAQGGTLNGVTVEGVLDLSPAKSELRISNGVSLTGAGGTGVGTINLTGAQSYLQFYGSQTLATADINFGAPVGQNPAKLEVIDHSGAGDTLTLGSGVVINHAGSHADLYIGAFASDSLVNQGQINANAGYFGVIGGGVFINQGTLDVSGGDLAALDSGAFQNSGLLEVNGGGLIVYSALRNFAGGVLSGGTFEVTGASTLLLPTGDLVAVDKSTIILSGAGSVVESYDPSTKALVTLDSSLTSIVAGGTLELLGGRTWSGSGVLTNGGTVILSGSSLSSASLTNSGSVTGHGTIAGTVRNNGLIFASGGVLGLAGATLTNLTGSMLTGGTLEASAGAVVELANNVAVADLAGTVILDGAGSEVQSFNTLSATQTTIEASLNSIAAAGALELLDARNFSSAKAITNSGRLQLSGGLLSGAALDDLKGSTLIGFGEVAAVIADGGATSSVGGPLSFVAAGDTFAGALGGSEIDFAGGSDLLGSGAALSAGTIGLSGNAAVTLGASLSFAGLWRQGASSLNVGANGLTLTGTGSTIGGKISGAGELAFTAGAVTIGAGANLAVAKINVSGAATAISLATSLVYAGTWSQTAGNLAIAAGDKVTFSGSASRFAGTIGGAGSVAFAGSGDVLSGLDLATVSSTITGATVTLGGVITLAGSLTATMTRMVIGTAPGAGATLEGGGALVLTNAATNLVVGASAASKLINVDDRIQGAGDLGGGAMTLINQTGGIINGDDSIALVIDTGASVITNQGTIEAIGAGGVKVASAVLNSGLLLAAGGTLTVDGAVTGPGAVRITKGAAIFEAGFGENVTFGAAGELGLADSQVFTGAISGFSKTGTTSLDLADIAFATGTTKASYSGTTAGGTLTVTDGTHTARIRFIGNYLGSTWMLSSDGHGGVTVIDPAATTPLAQAISSFAPSPASTAAPAAGAGREPAVGLARPRTQSA